MNTKQLPKLTTTSYALLGLLRRKPWSAYELTGFMRNSILRAVWPRAESHFYSEPKLLQKRGYVESRKESNGARKRTVYSITESGREALLAWLREERKSEFRFEYELLVRFAFAESVEVSVVMGYLQQVRQEALQDAREALAGVDAMLAADGGLQNMQGAPFTGAIINLIAEQLESHVNWVHTMSALLSGLEPGGAESNELAEDLYRQAGARLQALLAQGEIRQ